MSVWCDEEIHGTNIDGDSNHPHRHRHKSRHCTKSRHWIWMEEMCHWPLWKMGYGSNSMKGYSNGIHP